MDPDRPTPPAELIWRVTGARDATAFDQTGRQSVEEIKRALAVAGRSLDDAKHVLDFGCGCGRILRWLDDLPPSVRQYGVDIDPKAIAWASGNVRHATFSVNDGMPPLPFADDTFDVVFNHSVFTHLPENYQDAWLVELNRVARPDGVVLLTVSGDYPFAGFVQSWRDANADPSHWEKLFREKGIVYVDYDNWTGGPFPDFYHSTFHAPWYVFEHWSRFLEIRAYLVRGSLDFQDFVVLRPKR